MQAAWMKNEGRRNTRETSLAKWHATESAFRAAHLAIQVHGSYGYSAEYGIERYFRNARAPIIYEGTTQIHKLMQAEHALGYRHSSLSTPSFALSGYTAAASVGFDEKIATRARSSPSFRTWCAPSGPTGKTTTSPGSSTCSPSGLRKVGRPETTSSHSSSPRW